jgi:hypothetical protein
MNDGNSDTMSNGESAPHLTLPEEANNVKALQTLLIAPVLTHTGMWLREFSNDPSATNMSWRYDQGKRNREKRPE